MKRSIILNYQTGDFTFILLKGKKLKKENIIYTPLQNSCEDLFKDDSLYSDINKDSEQIINTNINNNKDKKLNNNNKSNRKNKNKNGEQGVKIKKIFEKIILNEKSSLPPTSTTNISNLSITKEKLNNTNDLVFSTACKELTINNYFDDKRKKLNEILGYEVPQ